MEIAIDVRGGDKTWDPAEIERLTRFALEQMGVPDSCDVSISLVSEEEIHALNRDYRGKDAPTDVLSFECDNPWDESIQGENVELGDVVIALDVVNAQREQFGTSFEQEASLMLVHSLLHLLGFDHMIEDDEREMQGHEKRILDAYGLTGIR